MTFKCETWKLTCWWLFHNLVKIQTISISVKLNKKWVENLITASYLSRDDLYSSVCICFWQNCWHWLTHNCHIVIILLSWILHCIVRHHLPPSPISNICYNQSLFLVVWKCINLIYKETNSPQNVEHDWVLDLFGHMKVE